MYKITKVMNKMRDELVAGGFSQEEAFAMCQNTMSGIVNGDARYPREEDTTVNVTVSKAGPCAEAQFSVPVKDFDKFVSAAQ